MWGQGRRDRDHHGTLVPERPRAPRRLRVLQPDQLLKPAQLPRGLDRLPLHRQKVEVARRLASSHPPIVGLALGGSLATGTADELSDVDLKIVADEGAVGDVTAWRDQHLVDACGRVVARFTAEHVGLPDLLVVLYSDLVHVDYQVLSLHDLARRYGWLPHVVVCERGQALTRAHAGSHAPASLDLRWIEDRMWAWLWYTQTKAIRGEVYEALDALGYLRAQVLFPLLAVTRGRVPAGARRVEEQMGELAAAFARTAPPPERAAAMDGVQGAAQLYVVLADPLLRQAGIAPAADARAVVLAALAAGLEWKPPQPVSDR